MKPIQIRWFDSSVFSPGLLLQMVRLLKLCGTKYQRWCDDRAVLIDINVVAFYCNSPFDQKRALLLINKNVACSNLSPAPTLQSLSFQQNNKKIIDIQATKTSFILEAFSCLSIWDLCSTRTAALPSVPAFSVAHWKQLQQEKDELELRFDSELQGLRSQQRRELAALEERLKVQHTADTKSLQSQQRAELQELRVKQREQVGLSRGRSSSSTEKWRSSAGSLSTSCRRLRRWQKTMRRPWWRWRQLTVTRWGPCRRNMPGLSKVRNVRDASPLLWRWDERGLLFVVRSEDGPRAAEEVSGGGVWEDQTVVTGPC